MTRSLGQGPLAVTETALANDSVTGFKIATDAISSFHIDDGSLFKQDLGTTVTANYDAPSLAAGVCDNFTFPTPTIGSEPIALVNPPGNFASTGLAFNWNIGINPGDDLNVRVCNYTAGAINAPSGGWKALVFAG